MHGTPLAEIPRAQSAFNVLFGRGSLVAFWPKTLDIGQIPQESKNRDIGAILAIFGGGILAIFGEKLPPPEICLPSAALWPLNAY